MFARPLTDELHTKRVLALREFARDELLLGLDAEEVVNVVKLAVLDEQGVPAEARAMRENDAGPSITMKRSMPIGANPP